MRTSTNVHPAQASVPANGLNPDLKNLDKPDATPAAPQQQATVNNQTVTAVKPTATTVKPSTDTASPDTDTDTNTNTNTNTNTKTKTWGEWFATPFTSIKNYFSDNKSDKAADEKGTTTISTAIPPEKTLGQRVISAVKKVLSIMALPFKFLGYVAYHVIYRPLNAFVITPLKNAYNYLFNPDKYIAEHGSKNISEKASMVQEDLQTKPKTKWDWQRYYAEQARQAVLKDKKDAEVEKMKPKAATLIELENKVKEGTLTLKHEVERRRADGQVKKVKIDKEVSKATNALLPTDKVEYARKGNVSEDDFNKEVEAYEAKVEAYNKSMEAYNEAVAEAKKNNTPLPKKPAPLAVIRPEKTPMAKCTDRSVIDAYMLSKEKEHEAKKVAGLTAEIKQLKAEAEKLYPGLSFTVRNESEKARLQEEIAVQTEAVKNKQEILKFFSAPVHWENSDSLGHKIQAEIKGLREQADVRQRYLVIHAKNCELQSASASAYDYAADIAEWKEGSDGQNGRDRLQLDTRFKQSVDSVKDEEGNITKVISTNYDIDSDQWIKNRPLPIPQQGLSWNTASLEERPYKHYSTVKDENGKVAGWTISTGKNSHWVVPDDKIHDNKGFDGVPPSVVPTLPSGLPPKASQDEEDMADSERLKKEVNGCEHSVPAKQTKKPEQFGTINAAEAKNQLEDTLAEFGYPPTHPIFKEDEGSETDDDLKSTTSTTTSGSYGLMEGRLNTLETSMETMRKEHEQQLTAVKNSNQEILRRLEEVQKFTLRPTGNDRMSSPSTQV